MLENKPKTQNQTNLGVRTIDIVLFILLAGVSFDHAVPGFA